MDLYPLSPINLTPTISKQTMRVNSGTISTAIKIKFVSVRYNSKSENVVENVTNINVAMK